MKKNQRSTTAFIAVLLTAGILLGSLSACSKDKGGVTPETTEETTTQTMESSTSTTENTAQVTETTAQEGMFAPEFGLLSTSPETEKILGVGEKSFTFEVVMQDGTTAQYLIYTDADTVGSALIELDLISGEDGPYGLYVTTVDGETLDYNNGGHYWAFYENGEYAAAGVDVTVIEPGNSYSFQASK